MYKALQQLQAARHQNNETNPIPPTQQTDETNPMSPSPHHDPFDRMLAAQAQVEGIPLVTADPVFRALGVRVLW